MLDFRLILLVVDFLKLMILAFERSEIEYDLFCECCVIKIHFVENLIQHIPSVKKREEARLIIDRCKDLISVYC